MKTRAVVVAVILLSAAVAVGGVSPGEMNPAQELALDLCPSVNISGGPDGTKSPWASTAPRIALDGTGAIFIAWEEDKAGNREALLTRLTFDLEKCTPGEQTVENISQNKGASQVPDLALNAPGTGFVVWQDNTANEDNPRGQLAILLRRFTAVEDAIKLFPDTLNISERPEGTAQRPTIAVDRFGRSFVAWEQVATAETGAGLEIFFRASAPYSPKVNVSGGRTGRPAAPRLAVDATSKVFIVWSGQEQAFGTSEIFMSRSANAGESFVRPRFDIPANISGPNSPGASEEPAIAIDRGGVQLVVWSDNTKREDNPEGDFEIFFRRSTEAFLPPANVSGGCTGGSKEASRQPSIAVDGSGNVLVAWQEVVGGNKEIFFASLTFGPADPFKCMNISNSPGASELPAIAVDGSGNVFIVWVEDVKGNTEVFLVVGKPKASAS